MVSKELVQRLREMRKEARYSQRALSEKLGFSKGWVEKVENERIGIHLYDISRWAHACGYVVGMHFTRLDDEAYLENTQSVSVKQFEDERSAERQEAKRVLASIKEATEQAKSVHELLLTKIALLKRSTQLTEALLQAASDLEEE